MLIKLETDRLILRQWLAQDRQPFAELNADPEAIAERGWGLWAVENKADGRFIGFVGLHIPTADLPFNPCVEIGWRLSQSVWGKGYATEAAKATLRAGFEILKFPEIVSFTSVSNFRSRAVMERIGMTPDASTFEHPNVPVGNKLREHCLYRISSEKWAAGGA